MSRTSARIARNIAIARSGIKPSHPDHPGHKDWLKKQYKQAKSKIRKLQAENKRLKGGE